MGKLTGKVAVVTGGNSGIGLATAKALRAEGARVAISGRDQKTLDAAVKNIGGEVLAIRSDVGKPGESEQFYKQVAEKWGKIDVLFANAGVAKFIPLSEVTEADFDQMFNINVRGLYFNIQKALPHLAVGASIVLNASVADEKGLAGSSVYSSTKAAVRSFARTLTSELADRKIRVNVVSPGPIPTPIFDRNGMSQAEKDATLEFLVAQIPMKRAGTAEEVASAVVFLASSDSSYISGVDLKVDGGMGQV